MNTNMGILYIAWGNGNPIAKVIKSCTSAKKTKLPTCLITDNETIIPDNLFDKIIRVSWKQIDFGGKNFIRKTIMYDYSPFDITLFLDADTVVLTNDLSYLFNMAKLHNICLAFAGRSFLKPVLRRIKEMNHLISHKDQVCYSSGMVCFKKSNKNNLLFNKWKDLMKKYQHLYGPDQEYLSIAINMLNMSPFVVPTNWNLGMAHRNNLLHNGVKIWHHYKPVPNNVIKFNENISAQFYNINAERTHITRNQRIQARKLERCKKNNENKRINRKK